MFDPIRIADAVAAEVMLFAGVGLLIGGLDDLLVDLIFVVQRFGRGKFASRTLASMAPPDTSHRFAVFVAAWDEAAVIGAMLVNALERFDHGDYRIYVGVYPNDRPTIDAVARVAEADERVRMVVGDRDGPTTKADNLNALWRAVARADAAEGRVTEAIVLHDAEDYVHRAELRVFDSLIGRHAVVQLPVLPLVARGSPLVSGHYADEFAEAHGKTVVVRAGLGAGMPLAGTGCAIARTMLARIAAERGGDPFDADSLTEDYELGLRIAELGGRATFARVRDAAATSSPCARSFPIASPPRCGKRRAG